MNNKLLTFKLSSFRSRSLKVAALSGVLALSLSSCSQNNENTKLTEDQLVVMNAWARISGMNGAVYMKILNNTDNDETLIGAKVSDSVASDVQIHETKMENNEMSMHQVQGIEIKAKHEAELKSGGYHIMLMGINGEHKPGEKIEVTLDFKNMDDMNIPVEIRE